MTPMKWFEVSTEMGNLQEGCEEGGVPRKAMGWLFNGVYNT